MNRILLAFMLAVPLGILACKGSGRNSIQGSGPTQTIFTGVIPSTSSSLTNIVFNVNVSPTLKVNSLVSVNVSSVTSPAPFYQSLGNSFTLFVTSQIVQVSAGNNMPGWLYQVIVQNP